MINYINTLKPLDQFLICGLIFLGTIVIMYISSAIVDKYFHKDDNKNDNNRT